MNILLRVLLAVYAFCLTFLSITTMLIPFRKDVLERLYDYLYYDVIPNRGASIGMFIVGLIFFALSLTFLLSGFRSDRDKRAVSKYTNIGEIKISLNSIESIALAASKKLMGVKETKAYVFRGDGGVSIVIKTVVLPDMNIPSLSEDIQVKVKSSVEECSGIKVNEVKVLVDNISSTGGFKARVE
ncbi:MAG: alkaline shock response membrane anchor protein AmaP [Clostridia bacterium]|nr:alkaline shock response membrane anchor protein AmaP [Clostridia bacterium]